MREYFKQLRRMIGVVTLLMACIFAENWISSRIAARYIAAFGFGFDSTEEAVEFVTASPTCHVAILSLSHWSIVVSLTMLSAWMLLVQGFSGHAALAYRSN